LAIPICAWGDHLDRSLDYQGGCDMPRKAALVIAFFSVFVASFLFVLGMFHIAQDLASPALFIATGLGYGAAKTIRRFLPVQEDPANATKGKLS
jgi:hypothetical protein